MNDESMADALAEQPFTLPFAPLREMRNPLGAPDRGSKFACLPVGSAAIRRTGEHGKPYAVGGNGTG